MLPTHISCISLYLDICISLYLSVMLSDIIPYEYLKNRAISVFKLIDLSYLLTFLEVAHFT